MTSSLSKTTRQSVRRHLAAGIALTVLLAGAVGGWAATAPLAGAVIAHGTLVVQSAVKQVQHPLGGVVSNLAVQEGETVAAGQILMRLDGTQARATEQIAAKRLDEVLARKARAEAEQLSLSQIPLAGELSARSNGPYMLEAVEAERKMFELRRAAREGQRNQLRGRIKDLEDRIAGLTGQISAKDEQIALLDQDLSGILVLVEKKVVATTRANVLKRDLAVASGERSELTTAVSEAKGQIAAASLQILQIGHDVREEASREIQDARTQIAELTERRTAAEDELRRTDIVAPQSGVVHKLSFHTIGGVVRAGETIMEIVPQEETLVVEVKIGPRDINDVHLGQVAKLRFSGVNQRTTPEVDGSVMLVSPDVSEDQRTGQLYYAARIAVTKDQLARLEGIRPVPGMPVEAFVKTGERTALSYFVQPLTDQVARAFNEK